MAGEGHGWQSLGWGLATAMLAHLLLLQIPLPKRLEVADSENSKKEPILIEKYPGEAGKKVVQTSKALEDLKAKDQVAKFAGEFQNRVEKETQSAHKGRFEEGKILQRSSPGGEAGKKGTGKARLSENSASTNGEIPQAKEEGESEGSEAEAKGPKLSDLLILGRTPNYLSKDIIEGNQTVLNTDKVLYASFINRIADEIYQPWVGFITEALHLLQRDNKKLESSSYITKLNVTMDKDGGITGISILTSSGVPELDEAPKKAFWRTEPFANPPSQLVEEDGYIRLVYEFHFEYKSSGFNIVPWTI